MESGIHGCGILESTDMESGIQDSLGLPYMGLILSVSTIYIRFLGKIPNTQRRFFTAGTDTKWSKHKF